MAIEEEFNIEIPDSEADKILSIADAVAFVSNHPMAKWSEMKNFCFVSIHLFILDAHNYYAFVPVSRKYVSNLLENNPYSF